MDLRLYNLREQLFGVTAVALALVSLSPGQTLTGIRLEDSEGALPDCCREFRDSIRGCSQQMRNPAFEGNKGSSEQRSNDVSGGSRDEQEFRSNAGNTKN